MELILRYVEVGRRKSTVSSSSAKTAYWELKTAVSIN